MLVSQGGTFTPEADHQSTNPSPHSTLSVDTSTGRANGASSASFSSSSVLPMSEHSSLPRQDSGSILDCPGDDIAFIDADQSKSDMDSPANPQRTSGVKFHGSEGLLNLSWLADHANQLEVKIDEHIVSTEDEEGNVEVSTSVTATVVMSDIEEDGHGEGR